MIEAPEGYSFNVQYINRDLHGFDHRYPSIQIQLWKRGDQDSGTVATKYVYITSMTDDEIVDKVEETARAMLDDLERENHYRELVKRNFS